MFTPRALGKEAEAFGDRGSVGIRNPIYARTETRVCYLKCTWVSGLLKERYRAYIIIGVTWR